MTTNGRPPKWTDPKKMQKVINAYFKHCEESVIEVPRISKGKVVKIPMPMPPTMAGLANALDIDRLTLLRYRQGAATGQIDDERADLYDRFKIIIARAKQKIEEHNVSAALTGLHEGRAANLNLASNFRYSQKSEVAVGGPLDEGGEVTEFKVTFVKPGERGTPNHS